MYAQMLGPGRVAEFDPPSPDGVEVLYSDEYVATYMRQRSAKRKSEGNPYSYAANNAPNRVDPFGLSCSENIPNTDFSDLGLLLCLVEASFFSKATLLEWIPHVTLRDCGSNKRFRVSQGNQRICGGLPGNCAWLGTTGAEPCVGVVIVGPSGSPAEGFHFEADDNPRESMFTYGGWPGGSKAIICGGDDSTASRCTLLRTITGLVANGVRDIFYAVNSEGNCAAERLPSGRWSFCFPKLT